MVKNRKKGQAALEFLMTYGWAFLVVLIMIGVLSYFGVLNPTKLLPGRCIVTPGFDCQDYEIRVIGNNMIVTAQMANQIGKSLNFQDYVVRSPSGWSVVGCTPLSSTQVPAGILTTVSCNITGGQAPLPGEKIKTEIDLIYQVSSTLYNRTSGWEVFATVN